MIPLNTETRGFYSRYSLLRVSMYLWKYLQFLEHLVIYEALSSNFFILTVIQLSEGDWALASQLWKLKEAPRPSEGR